MIALAEGGIKKNTPHNKNNDTIPFLIGKNFFFNLWKGILEIKKAESPKKQKRNTINKKNRTHTRNVCRTVAGV